MRAHKCHVSRGRTTEFSLPSLSFFLLSKTRFWSWRAQAILLPQPLSSWDTVTTSACIFQFFSLASAVSRMTGSGRPEAGPRDEVSKEKMWTDSPGASGFQRQAGALPPRARETQHPPTQPFLFSLGCSELSAVTYICKTEAAPPGSHARYIRVMSGS